MNIESLGYGAGAGFLASIFVAIGNAFGLNRRIGKVENEKLDKDVFIEFRKNTDDKFDILIKGQDKIWDRVDKLYDHVINQK